MTRHEKILFGMILVLGLALRLGTFAYIHHHHPANLYEPDSATYELPAKALLQTGHFVKTPAPDAAPETDRTPGYPVFIALIYSIFGPHYSIVIFVQILLGIGTFFLVYKIGRNLWSPQIALLAMFIMAIDLSSIHFSVIFLTETLFTLFMMMAIYWSLQILQGVSNQNWPASAAGTALALATYIRPLVYYLVVPLVCMFCIHMWLRHHPWRRIIHIACLFIIPWLLLIAPWHLRNAAVAGKARFSGVESSHLAFYKAADLLARATGESVEQTQAEMIRSLPDTTGWPADRVQALYQTKARQVISEHLGLFFKVSLHSGLGMYYLDAGNFRALLGHQALRSGPVRDIGTMPLNAYLHKWLIKYLPLLLLTIYEDLFMILLMLGLLIQWIHSWRRSSATRWSALLLMWGVIAYFTLLTALSGWGYSRYRVPVVPLLALLSAAGLQAGWGWLRRGRRPGRRAAQTPAPPVSLTS